MKVLAVLVCALCVASCAHDLSETYPFKVTLNTAAKGGLYELYWTFDNAAETISFAVRVQTTGWVGFGLSPNGQMPNSDVVIGWVKDGEVFFRDRFAPSRSPPTIDEQQDWDLVDGEEEGGFTILEFTRKYITCDDNDLPISAETAKVIWSFHNTTDPSSEELTFSLIHTHKASVSINLLGGLPSAAPEPDDLTSYDITLNNIVIPDNDTTYWCAAFKLPEEIRSQTRYVTKFGPVVTEGNEANVHHLLIYLCDSLSDIHVGNGGTCDDGVANEIRECRGGSLIAAWAVGGEDFLYPDNVAFPFGGEGFPQYLVMELHYDNPAMVSGTMDSSGMRMYYTSTPREHEAGILEMGYAVHHTLIVPPTTPNFTITGACIDECTSKYFPESGIHVFANMLHTHVVGRGLTLQHLRYNSECDVYEELEPIDRNLQYDFNFQQITHLPRERTVLPGDILQLQCFYSTTGVDGVTIGGLGTRDEMCLAFVIYYPKVNMTTSLSHISDEDFLSYLFTLPLEALQMLENDYVGGLNSVDWDKKRVESLQIALQNSTQSMYCEADDENTLITTFRYPEVACPYIAPDKCSGVTPRSCCDRVNGIEGAAVAPVLSVALLLLLTVLAAII